MARIAPDPEAVARGIPRMEKDQPSWQSTRGGVDLPEGSSGESPARWAASDEEVSAAVRILGRVLELAGRVQKYPTRVLLDSGSTGNFISTQFVAAAGLTIQPDSDWEEVTLADGSRLRTEGRVQFTLRCGKYKERVIARVFPNLHKEIILGIPWLETANPVIDWAQRRVRVFHRGCDVTLPLIQKRDAEATATELSFCTAKQMTKQVQRGHAVFLAVVRPAQEEETVDQSEGTGGTEEQKMYHEEMPAEIKAVLYEFKDIFPSDLPPGLPPVRKGHEFRIDLEDDTPPVHRPIYKLSPLELDECRKQLQYLLEKGFIRPSDSPYGAPILFVPKQDGGLRFCIDYR